MRRNRTPEEQRKADLARIHILKKDLGLSTEKYRNIIMGLSWSSSSADLTADERQKLIAHLAKMLARKEKKEGSKRSITDYPSKAQWGKINSLADDIKWRAGKSAGLAGFCKRMIHVPWPQTSREASQLIEHLKHMKGNQQKEATNA